MTIPAHSARPHTKWPFAILFGIIGSLVVTILVLAFVWPTATASAKNIPVAIAGPAVQVSVAEKALASPADGVIDFRGVSDRAAAITRIKQRDVYGAIILGAKPEVLTASAAGTAPTQMLTRIAARLQAQLVAEVTAAGGNPASVTVAVTDVASLSTSDATGAKLTTAAFPLVLGGMFGGILISLLVVGVARRVTALVVYGVASGLIVTLVLQNLFGAIQGNFLLNALGIGLSMMATASLVVGFNALIGPRGIAVGSVVTVLIGNPLSAATTPYQFLAEPWGAIGQYFVPGAATTLLRSLSYFPDANTTKQWLVLAAWAIGGLVISVAGHYRSRAPIALPAAELEDDYYARARTATTTDATPTTAV
ncbi:membrane protein [soil metagenome]